jgi:hypothetical protein
VERQKTLIGLRLIDQGRDAVNEVGKARGQRLKEYPRVPAYECACVGFPAKLVETAQLPFDILSELVRFGIQSL